MPLYEYRTESGDVVERCVPVEERDCQLGLDRITVPARVRTLCNTLTPDQVTSNKTLRGYYNEECKHGSRFQSSFTKEQIKQAWANN